jgi:hypothetical protein
MHLCASIAVVTAASSPYYVLNASTYAPLLQKEYAWANGRIPLLDFPQADINTTYYYRWRLFHEHVVSTSKGFVIDEFLPAVEGNPHNGRPISCAAGHHVAEGQWLRDPVIIDDVLRYWYEQGGNIYEYSNWIGWSAVRRQRLTGDLDSSARLLENLVKKFRGYPAHYLVNSTGRKCWWQVDDRDGMEYSISGSGCRPTSNSLLFGEAQAILELASVTKNHSLVAEFEAWRTFAQSAVLDQLWNPNIQSFATIPFPGPGQSAPPKPNYIQNPKCDLKRVRTLNNTVAVRELLGFVPW